MPKSAQPTKTSAAQQKFDQKWAQLEAQLDKEMHVLVPARHKVGQVLYEMKLLLRKYGLNKGRRGRWQAVLRKYGIDRKTAENWVRMYQEKARIPASKMVVAAAKKSQQNRQKNTVKRTVIGPKAKVDAGPEKRMDVSSEQRLPVECVFVLTLAEKGKFMESVKQLGPLRATQVVYKAVVAATAGTEI